MDAIVSELSDILGTLATGAGTVALAGLAIYGVVLSVRVLKRAASAGAR